VRWIIIIEEKLKAKEVADILNLSRSTIYKRLKNDKIDGYKENNEWVIIISENKNQDIYEEFLEKNTNNNWKANNNGFFDRKAVDKLLNETKSRLNNMGLLSQAAQNAYDQAQKSLGWMESMGTMDTHYNFMSEAEKFVQQHEFNMTADIFSRINRKYEMSKFNLGRDLGFSDRKIMRGFEIPKAVNFNLLEPLLDTTINGLKEMQNNYQIPKGVFRSSLALNTVGYEALNNMDILINDSISYQINNFLKSIDFRKWNDLSQINKVLYDQVDFNMGSSLDVSDFVRQVNKNIKYSETEKDIIPVSTFGTVTEQEAKLFILFIFILPVILYYGNPENIDDLILIFNSFSEHLTGYIAGETFGFFISQLKRLYKENSIGEVKMIIRDNAAIRHKPNVFAEVITRVKYEEYVKIQEDKDGWLLVQVLNRDINYAGFIKKEYVGKISI